MGSVYSFVKDHKVGIMGSLGLVSIVGYLFMKYFQEVSGAKGNGKDLVQKSFRERRYNITNNIAIYFATTRLLVSYS